MAMMGDMNWGVGMMALMSLVSLVVVVGIIGGVVLLVRALSAERRYSPPNQASALSILDERFARGDIDRVEYETRRGLLNEPAGRTRS